MQPKWFEAGAKDYGYSPLALIALEFLLLGFLEVKRYQGFKATGKVGDLLCHVWGHVTQRPNLQSHCLVWGSATGLTD